MFGLFIYLLGVCIVFVNCACCMFIISIVYDFCDFVVEVTVWHLLVL